MTSEINEDTMALQLGHSLELEHTWRLVSEQTYSSTSFSLTQV
jgi:hypothetical protein